MAVRLSETARMTRKSGGKRAIQLRIGHRRDWKNRIVAVRMLLEGASRIDFIRGLNIHDQWRKRIASQAIAAGFRINGYRSLINYDSSTTILTVLYRLATGETVMEVAHELSLDSKEVEAFRRVMEKCEFPSICKS